MEIRHCVELHHVKTPHNPKITSLDEDGNGDATSLLDGNMQRGNRKETAAQNKQSFPSNEVPRWPPSTGSRETLSRGFSRMFPPET